MFCTCRSNRKATIHPTQSSVDSPLQMRLIKTFGLHKYLLQKFVFRRKPSTYQIKVIQGAKTLYFDNQRYEQPNFYRITADIIQTKNHSIPIAVLKPLLKQGQIVPCIVYAHGNSSDMGDALRFVHRMSLKFRAEYVVFDYTGYGQSRKNNVGQEIICADLQYVLAWLNRPLKHIILWGFSLGTFPIITNAAKYPVAGVILQCPIGSLSCMFYEQYDTQIKFNQDHFANIDHIDRLTSPILMMHSADDEIIPIQQAKLLYHKFVYKNGNKNIQFLQVQKIKHNSFHKYIIANIFNDLQKEVVDFLDARNEEINLSYEQKLMPEPALFFLASEIKSLALRDNFDEEELELEETESKSTKNNGRSKQTEWKLCGVP